MRIQSTFLIHSEVAMYSAFVEFVTTATIDCFFDSNKVINIKFLVEILQIMVD